jgi:cholesterol transport system auxiliary component
VKLASLRRGLVVAALSMPLFGCAFFTKSDPVILRYFTPESIDPRAEARGAASGVASGVASPQTSLELRLGRINAASYLKDRIAFRDRSYEIGYYEELRWTEKPEAYLRRSLARGLFEEQGIHRIVSGPGTTLDVDLDAFEELRSPRHVARMQVTWSLRDDERVRFEETFVIERPMPPGPSDPGAIAAAMAQAFEASVARVVAGVTAALSRATP